MFKKYFFVSLGVPPVNNFVLFVETPRKFITALFINLLFFKFMIY